MKFFNQSCPNWKKNRFHGAHAVTERPFEWVNCFLNNMLDYENGIVIFMAFQRLKWLSRTAHRISPNFDSKLHMDDVAHQTFSSFCLRSWRIVACTNIEKVLNWGYHIALVLNLRHFIIWHTKNTAFLFCFFHAWANSFPFHNLWKTTMDYAISVLFSELIVSISKRDVAVLRNCEEFLHIFDVSYAQKNVDFFPRNIS